MVVSWSSSVRLGKVVRSALLCLGGVGSLLLLRLGLGRAFPAKVSVKAKCGDTGCNRTGATLFASKQPVTTMKP